MFASFNFATFFELFLKPILFSAYRSSDIISGLVLQYTTQLLLNFLTTKISLKSKKYEGFSSYNTFYSFLYKSSKNYRIWSVRKAHSYLEKFRGPLLKFCPKLNRHRISKTYDYIINQTRKNRRNLSDKNLTRLKNFIVSRFYMASRLCIDIKLAGFKL